MYPRLTPSQALLLTTFLPFILATNHIDIALQKRQNNVLVGTGVTRSSTPAVSTTSPASAAASTTNIAATTASSSTSPSVHSGSSQVPTTQTSDSAISSQSSQTDSRSQSTSSPSSGTSAFQSSSDSQSALDIISTRPDHSVVVASRSVISRTQHVTSTIVTVSGSSTFSHVLTTNALVPVSTSTSTSTAAPGVVAGDSDSDSPGLSPSSKRIIIGVVVGVGGAIILGGIAIVVWRIWGRRRNDGDDDNDLMGSHPGSSGHGKTSSVSGNTPFKSTLDQYHSPHSPPGPVNTASNF